MKKTAFTLITLLSASVFLFAQKDEKEKIVAYSNISEFGLMTVSHQSIAFEATTVQGLSIKQKHHIGLGIGIGYSMPRYDESGYIPLFVNYRFYFKPDAKISPHITASIGGLIVEAWKEYGIYSSFTMGFKVRTFSFSSGFSFMPMPLSRGSYMFDMGQPPPDWNYPFGITLKFGFVF